jgi:hypothetical protein
MIAARPSSGAGISEKTVAAERVWPSGARPAASLLISILRQPSPAKRVKRRDRRFFHLSFSGAAFFARHRSELNPACPLAETTTAAPLRLRRRGLVHRIVIQKPAPASARPPRCSCGGRNVTVRLWWVGTPIPACRAALVARQARNLSSLRQPDKRFPRVPKLLFPFSTSLVKPASTRGPDFEREIATLDEHWQERTIACSAKRVTSARRMTSTPAQLKGRKRNLARRWEDCGKSQ